VPRGLAGFLRPIVHDACLLQERRCRSDEQSGPFDALVLEEGRDDGLL
jgi:hypothetical protein